MPRARWLRRASVLATVVAAACGTDTIDLLPAGAGGTAFTSAGAGGGAGRETTAGGSTDPSGAGGSGGATSGAAGSPLGSGAASSGFGGNMDGGCSGFGCGGPENGFGGEAGDCSNFEIFCPCGPDDRCSPKTKCNLRIGRCMPECEGPWECAEGMLCEERSCAPCSEDQQCEQYGGFARRVCVGTRCEECASPSDCPVDLPFCFLGRCLQCLANEDCASGDCNKARGWCEK